MIVVNAHRVTDTSGEGFAVRLYRERNTTGFLRALSDQPAAFTASFSKVGAGHSKCHCLCILTVFISAGRDPRRKKIVLQQKWSARQVQKSPQPPTKSPSCRLGCQGDYAAMMPRPPLFLLHVQLLLLLTMLLLLLPPLLCPD